MKRQTAYIRKVFLILIAFFICTSLSVGFTACSGNRKDKGQNNTIVQGIANIPYAGDNEPDESGETVYITRNGECYHRKYGCVARYNPLAVYIGTAQKRGRRPCMKCAL